MSEAALQDEDLDADQLASYRDYYNKIAEHLDLGQHSHLRSWEEAAEAAEEARPRDPDEDDEAWHNRPMESGGSGSSSLTSFVDQERATIDALFGGLTRSGSRK